MKKKKEISNNELAKMIENLAISTAKGFVDIEDRLGARIDGLEERMGAQFQAVNNRLDYISINYVKKAL